MSKQNLPFVRELHNRMTFSLFWKLIAVFCVSSLILSTLCLPNSNILPVSAQSNVSSKNGTKITTFTDSPKSRLETNGLDLTSSIIPEKPDNEYSAFRRPSVNEEVLDVDLSTLDVAPEQLLVGDESTIVVTLLNSSGVAVPDLEVFLQITGEGGRLNENSTNSGEWTSIGESDMDGSVTAVLESDFAGMYEIRVRVEGTELNLLATVIYDAGVQLQGLQAEYFDNTTLEEPAVLKKYGEVVDYDWGTSAPEDGVPADYFSMRWSGQIEAENDEVYTFYTTSDEGVRLWVDNELIIDNWSAPYETENSGEIELQAGQKVDVILEIFDEEGDAQINLSWSSLSTPLETIPIERLSKYGIDVSGSTIETETEPVYAGRGNAVNLTVKLSDSQGTPLFGLPVSLNVSGNDDWIDGEEANNGEWRSIGSSDVGGEIVVSFSSSLVEEKQIHVKVADVPLSTFSVINVVLPTSTNGLRGDYYPNINLNDPVAETRIDPALDFWLGYDNLPIGIEPDNFSVRWVGRVEAEFSETYTFHVLADDGIALWVDGQLLVENWSVGSDWYSGQIDLQAGQKYDLVMEHFQESGEADLILEWSSEHTPQEVIPEEQLSYEFGSQDLSGSEIQLSEDHALADGEEAIITTIRAANSSDLSISGLPVYLSISGYGNIIDGNEQFPGRFVYLGLTDEFGVVTANISSFSAGDKNIRAFIGGDFLPDSSAVEFAIPDLTEGLQAEYFTNQNLTPPAAQIRYDQQINHDWSYGSPAIGLPYDNFSARWSGQLLADYDGMYTLYLSSDDGARLWIDGVLLINGWYDRGRTEDSVDYYLEAGQYYDIVVEYYENGGAANISLEWESSQVSRKVIPVENYRSVPDFPNGRFEVTADSVSVPANGRSASGINIHVLNPDGSDVQNEEVFIKVTGSGSRINGTPVGNGEWVSLGLTDSEGNVYASLASTAMDHKLISLKTIVWLDEYILGISFDENNELAGLKGTYFSNPLLQGPASFVQYGQVIDFDWEPGGPIPKSMTDNFSVRWEGNIDPDYSETYTFFTNSNEGVRLWVDGELLIDNWDAHTAEWDSAQIDLEAGVNVDIVLEYYEVDGDAVIQMEWSSPSTERQIIPVDNLGYPQIDLASSTISSEPAQVSIDHDSVITVNLLNSNNVPVAGEDVFFQVNGDDCTLNGIPVYWGDWIYVGTSGYDGTVNAVLQSSEIEQVEVRARVENIELGTTTQVTYIQVVEIQGFLAEYFDDTSLEGPAILKKYGEVIDYDWGTSAPEPGVPEDHFSARWSGQIEAEYDETYTFYAGADEGIRLWVDNQLIIDNWSPPYGTENKGEIALSSGEKVDVTLEIFDETGDAYAYLAWSSSSLPFEIVPLENASTSDPDFGGSTIEFGKGPIFADGESELDLNVRIANSEDVSISGLPVSINVSGSSNWVGDEQIENGQWVLIGTSDDDGLVSTSVKSTTSEEKRVEVKIGESLLPIVGEFFVEFPPSMNGLRADYYLNTSLEPPISFTRIDPVVDFVFGESNLPEGIGPDNYSIRWTGQVTPDYSELYTFYTLTDDGVRLWVDGELLIDNWTVHGPEWDSGEIYLEAGNKYDLVLEYFQQGGGADMHFEWDSERTPREVIPQENLSYGSMDISGTTVQLDPGYAPADGIEAITVTVNVADSNSQPLSGLPVYVSLSGYGNFIDDNELAPQSFVYLGLTDETGAVTTQVSSVEAGVKLMRVKVQDAYFPNETELEFLIPGLTSGLQAEYFTNPNLDPPAAQTRYGEIIDYDWMEGNPINGIPSDQFSIRWSGYIWPSLDGMYTLYLTTDDGARLWVNGELMINSWYGRGPTEDSIQYDFEEGQYYEIVIEYYEDGGGASAKLEWESSQIAREIIPLENLRSIPDDPNGRFEISASPRSLPANGRAESEIGIRVVDEDGAAVQNESVYLKVTGDGSKVSGISVESSDWTYVGQTDSEGVVQTTLASSVADYKLISVETGDYIDRYLLGITFTTNDDISGLKGTFFPNSQLLAPAAFVQYGQVIDYDWGSGGPFLEPITDNFSVRWEGYINPEYDETYTFYTYSDEGVRLWVDDDLLIDNWNPHTANWDSGNVQMSAGHQAKVVLEYYETTGDAVIRLEWSSASQTQEIIPLDSMNSDGISLNSTEPDVSPSYPIAGNNAEIAIQITTTEGLVIAGLPAFLQVYNEGCSIAQTPVDPGNWIYLGETGRDGRINAQFLCTASGVKRYSVRVQNNVLYDHKLIEFLSSADITGLLGEYFNNPSLEGNPVADQFGEIVDHDWGVDAPFESLPVDNFSIRWSGQVSVPVDGLYTFYTEVDGGVRLYINDQLVIDDWVSNGLKNDQGQIELQSGTTVDIRLEYFDDVGDASVRLDWSAPELAREVVPHNLLSFPGVDLEDSTVEYGTARIYSDNATSLPVNIRLRNGFGVPLAGLPVSVQVSGTENLVNELEVEPGAWTELGVSDSEGDITFTVGSSVIEEKTIQITVAGLSLPTTQALQLAWSTESQQIAGYYGWSASIVGDINGDGYDDVVVGSPYYANGQANEGAIFAYYGSQTGLDTNPGLTLEGGVAQARFGWSVSGAGDVNQDGFDDVVVSSLGCSRAEIDEGCVYIYYGSENGLSSTPSLTLEGNQDYAAFGYTAGSAGDINGDQYDDVYISAPNLLDGNSNLGAVYVYLGGSSGLNPTPAWIGFGQEHNSLFGLSVSSAGDVNLDGFGDLIIGAPNSTGTYDQEGTAYVYYGSANGLSETADWSVSGNQAYAHLGEVVSLAGDLNKDGIGDILVGAPDFDGSYVDSGELSVFQGSMEGLAPQPLWVEYGDQAGDQFGRSISALGDFNGDGYIDILIGANGLTSEGGREGKIYIYFGGDSGFSGANCWT